MYFVLQRKNGLDIRSFIKDPTSLVETGEYMQLTAGLETMSYSKFHSDGTHDIIWQSIIKDDFLRYKLSGTTDGFGKISNPQTDYKPLCALDINYMITADVYSNVIRVINVSADPILERNYNVEFYILGIKKSAIEKIIYS